MEKHIEVGEGNKARSCVRHRASSLLLFRLSILIKCTFTLCRNSLVSTKKSQEFFEIIEIQLVVRDFAAQRFEIYLR